MKHQIFLTVGCAAVLFVAAGTALRAQDSQDGKSSQANAKDSSSVKKHRVWTDDEVSTLRTPEDNYVDQKQAAEAATAAAAASRQNQSLRPTNLWAGRPDFRTPSLQRMPIA